MIPPSWSAWGDLADQPWVRAAVTFAVGIVVVRALASLAARRFELRGQAHRAMVVRTALTYLGALIVTLVTANVAGFDLNALLATAGVATVAIGFAAQTSLSNLIAGLFLLVDRPFQVGDTIGLESRLGVVLEVSLMSTLVRTFDNVVVRWPNEVVLKATILNFTRMPARRIDLRVGVAYGTDLAEARALLTRELSALPDVLLEPALEVIARALLDSAVELEVRAWVPANRFVVARTALVERTHDALREAGVEIPFPQRTVWLAGEGAAR